MNSSSSFLSKHWLLVGTLVTTLAMVLFSSQLVGMPIPATNGPGQPSSQVLKKTPQVKTTVQTRAPRPQIRLMEVDQFQVDPVRSAESVMRDGSRRRRAERGNDRIPLPNWRNSQPPSSTDFRQPGNSNQPFSLDDLPDTEKNELWWAIAARSRRSGDVAYSYTLTTVAALKIGSKYEVSAKEVFRFFRAGLKAEWRHPTPPIPE